MTFPSAAGLFHFNYVNLSFHNRLGFTEQLFCLRFMEEETQRGDPLWSRWLLLIKCVMTQVNESEDVAGTGCAWNPALSVGSEATVLTAACLTI